MKIVFSLVIALASGNALAELNAVCVFDKLTAVYSTMEREPERFSIAQTMTIKGGATTSETLSLDGKARATNSSNWEPLLDKPEDNELSYFIGDTGEFLTIFHIGNKSTKPLKGSFRSTLLNSGYYQSGVRYGQCALK